MNVSIGTIGPDVNAVGQVSLRMIWVLRCLCLTGLGISGYLAWTAFSMVPVYGCGGGEVIDCGHVLNSKWSKVLGMPVSVPAVGLYASMLAMLSFAGLKTSRSLRQIIWSTMTAGACLAGLAALWFVGLQIFVLSHICPYCLAVHFCGIILAVLMLRNKFSTALQKSIAASCSTAAVAALITIQVMTPEPEVFQVVRYDDAVPANVASVEPAPGESNLFSPPGEVFEAPAEVFEAPGAATEKSVSVPSPETSDDAVNADGPDPVTSTLLLILPPRCLMLMQLVGQQDAPSDTPADEAKAVVEAKTELTDVAKDPGAAASEKPKSDTEGETPKPAVTAPEVPKQRTVTVAGNTVTLNVKQWPLLGKPNAQYIFVEMFDYTCPHCRNTHHAIKGAFEQYGENLAIVALAVPLDPSCNNAATGSGHAGACELAKISVTVWRVSPENFREFHDWMFESTRTVSSARAQAEKLVGAERFQKEYASKVPADYVKRHVDLYKKVGQGSVPKLLFPKSTINGEINSKSTLCSTIERELQGAVIK